MMWCGLVDLTAFPNARLHDTLSVPLVVRSKFYFKLSQAISIGLAEQNEEKRVPWSALENCPRYLRQLLPLPHSLRLCKLSQFRFQLSQFCIDRSVYLLAWQAVQ